MHGPNLVVVLRLGEGLFADGTGFFVTAQEHQGIHQGFAQFLAHAESSTYTVQDIHRFGVLVKPHVGLGEVNAKAAAGLGVVEPLHHDQGLVPLAKSPQGVAQVDDVFRVVGGVLQGSFGTFAGPAVVEYRLVHFSQNRKQLAVLADQFHLAFKMADARAIEFLKLIDEPAVDQVQGFFRVHLVGPFEVAEGYQGLVF